MPAEIGQKIRRTIEYRPDEWERLNAARGRTPLSTFVRDAALEKANGSDGNAVTLVLKHGGACGPWRNTEEQDDTSFTLSPDFVRLWNVQADDWLLHTEGDSMKEHGIPDEAILHIRPFHVRSPRSGEVCAITAWNEDGDSWGTVKEWHWGGRSQIELRNGEGKELKLPGGANCLKADGYWTGGAIGLTRG